MAAGDVIERKSGFYVEKPNGKYDLYGDRASAEQFASTIRPAQTSASGYRNPMDVLGSEILQGGTEFFGGIGQALGIKGNMPPVGDIPYIPGMVTGAANVASALTNEGTRNQPQSYLEQFNALPETTKSIARGFMPLPESGAAAVDFLTGLSKAGLGALRMIPGAPIEATAQYARNLVGGPTKPAIPPPTTTPESVVQGKLAGQDVPGITPYAGTTEVPTLVQNAVRFGLPIPSVEKMGRAAQAVRKYLPRRVLSTKEINRLAREIRPGESIATIAKINKPGLGSVTKERAGDVLKGRPLQESTELPSGAFQDFVSGVSPKISPVQLGKQRAGAELAGVGRTPGTLQKAALAARKGPSLKYEEAKRIGGDAFFDQPNLKGAIDDINREAKAVQGPLTTRAERIAPGLIPEQAPLQTSLGRVGDLPPEIVSQLGIGGQEGKTFAGMLSQKQRISNLRREYARSTIPGSDNIARQLRILENGIDADLHSQQVTASIPDAVRLVDQANVEYSRNVAPYFTERAFARKISDLPPETIVDQIFKKNNISEIRNVKGAIAQLPISTPARVNQFRRLSRTWYDDLVEDATNATTGEFDKNAFMRSWESYSDDVKREILGIRNFREVQKRVDAMRKAEAASNLRPPVLGALLGKKISSKEASTVLDTVVREGNARELNYLRQKYPRNEWNIVVRGWFDDIVASSIDSNTGRFDNALFLSQIERTKPEVRRALMGGRHASALKELVNNLQRTNVELGTVLGQPSPFLLRIGAVKLGSQLAEANVGGAAKTAFVFLAPFGVSKIFMNPRGTVLLNRALQVPEGSKAALQIAAELQAMVNAKEDFQEMQ